LAKVGRRKSGLVLGIVFVAALLVGAAVLAAKLLM
jgi:hypothetical protein